MGLEIIILIVGLCMFIGFYTYVKRIAKRNKNTEPFGNDIGGDVDLFFKLLEEQEYKSVYEKRKSYEPLKDRKPTMRTSANDDSIRDGMPHSGVWLDEASSINYHDFYNLSSGTFHGFGDGGSFGGGGASGSWDSSSDSSSSYDSGSSDSND